MKSRTTPDDASKLSTPATSQYFVPGIPYAPLRQHESHHSLENRIVEERHRQKQPHLNSVHVCNIVGKLNLYFEGDRNPVH
ncbi:hypothetical protein J6590_019152 [Homalodisca vitripennis]|nr:hypothetical protein J6590_019152 [Homalodisca vitripennis]